MKPCCDICGRTARQARGKLTPVLIGSRRMEMCAKCRGEKPAPASSIPPNWERVREIETGTSGRNDEAY